MSNVSSARPAFGAGVTGSETVARPRGYGQTVGILALTGVLALLLAQQVATGWLALGERANIPRSNLNFVEVLIIVVGGLWGLLMLRSAWGLWRQKSNFTLRGYLEGRESMFAPGPLLAIAVTGMTGILCAAIAEQVLTGWLPLGPRANIPRSNLNYLEIGVILASALGAFINLGVALNLAQRNRRAWAWAQWTTLITAVGSLMVILSGVTDLSTVIPPGGTLRDNLAGALDLLSPGLLLFLSSIAAYRYLTYGVETSAAQGVRNQLAQSPGAGAIIGFIALFAGFSIATDLFLDPRALAGALSTNITNGIVAIGITMLMISGEFDLSVGSIHGAAALMFLLMITEGLFGLPPFHVIPAALLSLVFAAFLGFINGILLIKTGIPSFIVTLGTLLAYRAIPLVVIADGRILRYADYRLPEPNLEFSRILVAVVTLLGALVVAYMGYRILPPQWVGIRRRIDMFATDENDFRLVFLVGAILRFVITAFAVIGVVALLVNAALYNLSMQATEPMLVVSFFNLANGRIAELPIVGQLAADINLRLGIFWWMLLVIVFQFILNHTPYGNYTFAAGGNPGAARAQGINVNRIKVINFMLSGIMAGVAGITYVSRVGSVNANLGEGLELEVIAAAVIGGTLLSGGYGSIFGALLGVFIFGMLRTGLVLVGMAPQVFFGVIGVIIIIAVVINTSVRRIKT
jgi:ribose/xylose/arabinose/galactoside ABC-type transport system permease subunit